MQRATSYRVGLIGAGIAGSLTPALHEAEGAAQGLDYRYDRIDCTQEPHRGQSLEALLSAAEAQGYAGVNITYPFKQSAVALLDWISPQAAELGAVNTVVFRDGQRQGHNSDYAGFRAGFTRELGDMPKAETLLVGAGGAGGAVGLALLDSGVERLWIQDLAPEAAAELARRLAGLRPAARVGPWVGPWGGQGVDGLVNATPMGMAAHPGAAVDLAQMSVRHWVADIVYFPLWTALLRQAQTQGLRRMTGGGMAVGQAAVAFEHFCGRPADAARMAAHFETLIQGQT